MDHFVLFTKEPHYVDYIILGHIAQNIYEPPPPHFTHAMAV